MSHRRYATISAAAVAATVATVLLPAAAHASAVRPTGKVSAASSSSAFAKSSAPALKTFKSTAASHLHHVGSGLKPAVSADAGAATVFVNVGESCTTDTGTGTAANPYCSIQDGVNAAASGDTVSVSGSLYIGSVTVSTSDLTIVATGTTPTTIIASNASNGESALILQDVSGVTVSNFELESSLVSTVSIVGSTGITLDSDDVLSGTGLAAGAVAIDGASSGVTVSRTSIAQINWAPTGVGLDVQSGARNVVAASDLFADFGGPSIEAAGVAGLDIVGDTIQRSCGSAVSVGSSSRVSVQNNLLEDANPVTDLQQGGDQAECANDSVSWAPDITVDAASASSAVSDFNDFYTYGSDGTAPYNWGGTAYTTLAAFQSATGLGTNDTNDSVEAAAIGTNPTQGVGQIDAKLQAGSAAIGSASASAPGALASDFYGNAPYVDRGAIAFTWDNLVAGVSVSDKTALSVTADGAASSGDQAITTYSFNWGDGPNSTTTSSASLVTHTYTKPGTYTVTLTVTDAKNATSTTSVVIVTAGSGYTAYGPARVLDTRSGIGTGGSTAQLSSGSVLQLQIGGTGGAGGIPAGVTAVAMNLTLTNTSGFGNVIAYPDGAAQPTTSNLNYNAGQTVANAAIIPVGTDGLIDFAKQGPGSVDIIGDVNGYYTQNSANGYFSLTPTRILDTRNGIGGVTVPLTSNQPIRLSVTNTEGVFGTPVAVAVNLTLTDSSGFGNVIAYPDGSAQPSTSNLNYTAGQTIANAAIVPVTDGYIDIAKQGPGSVDMIVDLEGYFGAFGVDAVMSAYVPVLPKRLFDSRMPGEGDGPLQAGFYYAISVTTQANGTAAPGVTSLVLNTTVTNVTGVGFVTVFPDNAPQNGGVVSIPNASNLNFDAGQTVPNLTFVAPGQEDGVVDFYNGALQSSLDLIVDIFGYYQDN